MADTRKHTPKIHHNLRTHYHLRTLAREHMPLTSAIYTVFGEDNVLHVNDEDPQFIIVTLRAEICPKELGLKQHGVCKKLTTSDGSIQYRVDSGALLNVGKELYTRENHFR